LSHPILRHSPSSFLPRSATRLALPSFPTRRSSDLPLLVSDLEEQPRWAWPAWAHLRSLLVLPLMIQGEVLGVVSLHHREPGAFQDRKSTRLNSSHVKISYAVFCLKKKTDT